MTKSPSLLILVTIAALSCSDEVSGPVPDVYAHVSGGNEHSCGLLGDGTLYCWGNNSQLQLGNGGTSARDSFPVPATTTIKFTSLEAAETHSCALTGAGEAYCWGLGFDGELGAGAPDQASTPIAVQTSLRFTQVVTGQSHTCGLSTGSLAYCWGLNEFGVLGRDTTHARTPVSVIGPTFRDITAGTYHTCAITVGGAAACWGSNAFGQAGTGDTTTNGVYVTPAPVSSSDIWASLSAGHSHTCGLTINGVAYCWGSNLLGMLGDGTRTDSRTPVPVAGGHTFAVISVGANQSCAITPTGQLYCWGNNNTFGGTATATCNVGPGVDIPCSLSPIPAAPGLSFGELGVGSFHTCGVLIGGGAMCWGANEQGQVGNGEVGTTVTTPTRVEDP